MKRYRKRRKSVSGSQIFLYRYFFVGKARKIEGLKGTLVSPQEIFLYRYRESVVGDIEVEEVEKVCLAAKVKSSQLELLAVQRF